MIGDKMKPKAKRRKMMFAHSLRERAGFTIVEMLFATGLFALVITLVVTVYVTSVSNQRKAFGLQDVLDNSRYVLETMARAIRQSNINSVSSTQLDLDHPSKGSLSYYLNGTKIMEDTDVLTGPGQVVVEDLQFIGQGIASGDGQQPRVTIIMRVRSDETKTSEQTFINLQTTVTSRNLQIP